MGESITDLRQNCIIGPDCREDLLAGNALQRLVPGIDLCGISELAPPYAIARPAPPFSLVLLTRGGAGLWHSDEGPRRLVAGDCLILPPHRPQIYAIDDALWRIAWLHVRGSLSEAPLLLSDRPIEALAEALAALLAAVRVAGVDDAGARLAARLVQVQLRALIDRSGGADPTLRLLDIVEHQLRLAPGRAWSVASMARLVDRSAAQLHRICVRHRGCAPGRLLTRIRLERARALLGSGERVRDVAAAVGYGNEFAFSTAFRRCYGHPPSAERLPHGRAE